MKLKELEDIVYQIATSNFTTKEMNNVCNLADDIIYSFKHLCSDYNE